MWLHGCFLHPLLVNQSAYHCTMDDVHTFEGVHDIPIKVVRDKERNRFLLFGSRSRCTILVVEGRSAQKLGSLIRLAWAVGLATMCGFTRLFPDAGDGCTPQASPILSYCSPIVPPFFSHFPPISPVPPRPLPPSPPFFLVPQFSEGTSIAAFMGLPFLAPPPPTHVDLNSPEYSMSTS